MAFDPKSIFAGQDNATEFLPVSWVARRLSLSPKRIYQLIEAKRLVAVKFGPRQTRILRESFDDYVCSMLADEREDAAETAS
ncbi:helix-turn-helix domain-containing protein [bacterium]|nr:helix-turn-helix domain-containing protein [bacterium]